jgi:predicted ATPase
LVIDDARWADAPSLRWLAYLARRLDGVALLVALGCRDAEPGADTTLLAEVLSEAHAGVMRPRPLTRAGVERWLTNNLRCAAGGRVCRGLPDGDRWQRVAAR